MMCTQVVFCAVFVVIACTWTCTKLCASNQWAYFSAIVSEQTRFDIGRLCLSITMTFSAIGREAAFLSLFQKSSNSNKPVQYLKLQEAEQFYHFLNIYTEFYLWACSSVVVSPAFRWIKENERWRLCDW